ncbi:unnamed protein product, partial [Musa acuminata subsp. burmannicoides]
MGTLLMLRKRVIMLPRNKESVLRTQRQLEPKIPVLLVWPCLSVNHVTTMVLLLTLEIKLSDMKAVDKGCDKFVLAQEETRHVVLQKEPFFKTPDMAEDEVTTFE